MDRQEQMRRLHADLVALEAKRQAEKAQARRGAWVLVALVVVALVIADHVWGLGLWIGLRELVLHVRP